MSSVPGSIWPNYLASVPVYFVFLFSSLSVSIFTSVIDQYLNLASMPTGLAPENSESPFFSVKFLVWRHPKTVSVMGKRHNIC